MDHLQKFIAQLQNRIALLLLLNSTMLIGGYWLIAEFVGPNLKSSDQAIATTIILVFIAFLSIIFLATIGSKWFSAPLRYVWMAVLHISPDTANTPAPDIKDIRLGRELVTSLVNHVYQLASIVDTVEKTAASAKHDLKSDFVANSLPLPLIVLDKDANVLFANEALLKYMGRSPTDTIGQNVYAVMDMLFSNEHTFDAWLEKARADKVTSNRTWSRVRLNVPGDSEIRYVDLVAYYNKNNPEGFEIMLVLFDRTKVYSQDDQAMSLVALAVHELRTPLTLLRGYIDVFEEELGEQLNDEMKGFMHKMKVAAQQLASFTSNVLNVARFENNQLVLKLQEERWEPILQAALNDMSLRAKVRGVTLKLQIGDNLPTVGVDALSAREVVNNLLDNAIKYSQEGKEKEIIVKCYVTQDGVVETTVQDFGPGIPEAAMSNLFNKFYRDYHNRTHVGGTGMGLYLSKAIVNAHGGNIWVRSKEGQGSTFGFTLLPYSQLADEVKTGDNADITRTVGGWIKNHTLYRR
ncbi:MAG TPA: ATP-binding protein [Candidatus Saccharimonadales bacterium]|nr:ATP-binding protein [Candidatus Saccharimonadales bacterium]